MNLDALTVLMPTMLKPNRDGLEALITRLMRTDQAQEAWEFVAPSGWIGESSRRFQGRALDECPPTVGAVAAFCVNPEGILRSEALAREVAQRLVPFGASSGTTLDTVVWSFWPNVLWTRGELPEPQANAAFTEAARQVSTHVTAAQRDVGKQWKDAGLPAWLWYAATMALAWERATGDVASLAGRASPFEPLIELAAAGVILHHIDDRSITLVMPSA